MFSRITQRLIEGEQPILADHGLSMWEYIVLSRLGWRSAPTQLELAQTIGYDKTRLIALLDGLEGRDLLSRAPDPSDRRARIVRLTVAGEAILAKARAGIRAMEEGLLADLTSKERETLLRVLPILSALPADADRA